MKKIIYLVAAFLCMACSDDNESNQQNGGASSWAVSDLYPLISCTANTYYSYPSC